MALDISFIYAFIICASWSILGGKKMAWLRWSIMFIILCCLWVNASWVFVFSVLMSYAWLCGFRAGLLDVRAEIIYLRKAFNKYNCMYVNVYVKSVPISVLVIV